MTRRCFAAVLTVMAVPLLAPAGAVGQTLTATTDGRTEFRTTWGDPDLQGIWTNSTTTRLERPDDLAGQEFLTDEERIAGDEERIRNSDQKP